MTPFINYDGEVRRIWRNIRRRYLRYCRIMTARKAAGLPYKNVVSIDQWLIGSKLEDTYLNERDQGNRMAVRQRLAARTLSSPEVLMSRGMDPGQLYAALEAYVSARLGVAVELADAISYSGSDDGEVDRDTVRFVKKRLKKGWQ